jgi:glycosyltransferase involved in cell wall biosynthesis
VLLRDAHQAKQLSALIRSIAALRFNERATLAHVVLVDDESPLPVAQTMAKLFAGVCEPQDASAVLLPAGICEAQTLDICVGARRVLVTVLRKCRNAGPAAARNAGVRALLAARHPPQLLLFSDADVTLTPGWLAAMAAAATAHEDWRGGDGAVLLSGRTLADGPWLLAAFHNTFGTLNGRFKPLTDGRTLLYACTCNMATSAGVFTHLSLWFDEAFPAAAYEDCCFCVALWRVRPHAARFVPAAEVHHDFWPRPSLGAQLAWVAPACTAALCMAAATPTSMLLALVCAAAAAVARFVAYACLPLARQAYRYGRSEPLMVQRHPDYFQLWQGSESISNTRVCAVQD